MTPLYRRLECDKSKNKYVGWGDMSALIRPDSKDIVLGGEVVLCLELFGQMRELLNDAEAMFNGIREVKP